MYLIDGETKCKCSLYALQEKSQNNGTKPFPRHI